MVISGAFSGIRCLPYQTAPTWPRSSGNHAVCPYWGYVEDYLSFLYHYSGSICSIGIILSLEGISGMDTVNLFLDTIGGRFHISPLVLMPMAVFDSEPDEISRSSRHGHRHGPGCIGGSVLSGLSHEGVVAGLNS